MNVFGKPNEQNQACLSFAMAGKGRKNSNELAEENNEAAHTIVSRFCDELKRSFGGVRNNTMPINATQETRRPPE